MILYRVCGVYGKMSVTLLKSVQERSERIMKLLYSFNRKKQIENIKEVITSTFVNNEL